MHTKGEWKLQKITDGYRIITGEKHTMNLVGPWYPSPAQAEEFEANARLIKEAPVLLDVVRDCVNFLADLNTTPGMMQRAKELHKRAYTAHSKAKGE